MDDLSRGMAEVARRFSEVQAERDALRAALRPFVDCNFTYFSGKVLGSDAKLTREDVERARSALGTDGVDLPDGAKHG